MKENNKPSPVLNDNPIRDSRDDCLGRTDSAKSFAQQVLLLDASEGVAIGVFGPWGSGKTSFINLARKEFKHKEIPVLDFNPWMFSGTEQLVGRFFAELSAAMGETSGLKTIGQALREYGSAINAVANVASTLLAIPQIGDIVKTMLNAVSDPSKQPESANQLRSKVECALRKRDDPIIVVLDDVDRLTNQEIKDIFKLVRLTASFPNLVYIVACDRLRVEQALDKENLPGRDYLEKIIQLPFTLPEIPRLVLWDQMNAAITNALGGFADPGPCGEETREDTWNVYIDIIFPLIRNMRDVRRYAIAIRMTVSRLEDQVAHIDILALETVRLFLPDVFDLLPSMIDLLTVTSPWGRNVPRSSYGSNHQGDNDSHRNARIDKLRDAAAQKPRDGEPEPESRGAVTAMIRHIFPPSEQSIVRDESYEQWAGELLSQRRVAHAHVLQIYLEYVVGDNLLVFHDAEQAFEHMPDRDKLDRFIRSLDPARWRAVFVCLATSFKNQFGPEHVESGIVVVLNLLPDVPHHQSNIVRDFALFTRQLLRVLDAAAVEAAVCRISPWVTSLSSRMQLVVQSKKIVSTTAAAEFDQTLCNEIQSASVDSLAEEWNLFSILNFYTKIAGPAKAKSIIGDSPQFTFNLLWTAQTTDLINDTPHLCLLWDSLIEFYGDEEALKERIESLRAQFDNLKPWIEHRKIPLDDAERLLELAEKYQSGRWPEIDR